MRLERLALIGLIVLSITACSTFTPNADKEPGICKTILDGNVIIYNSGLYDMTIVGFKGDIEIIYDAENPPTLKQAGQLNDYRYLINGSYFHASREHAGWLSILGTQHAELLDDKQLSHIVVLNKELEYIDFPGLEIWNDSSTSSETIEFQTGPMVVAANTVDTLSINASINGKGAHLRTLLAFTEEDGMRYFIICRDLGPLENIGEHLLSLPVFKDKTLWAVNLDGGSSTALYSRDYPILNFNTERPLPILLGIK